MCFHLYEKTSTRKKREIYIYNEFSKLDVNYVDLIWKRKFLILRIRKNIKNIYIILRTLRKF